MKTLSLSVSLFVFASLAATAGADTIFDQFGTNATTTEFTSQVFGAPNDKYSGITIDDFTSSADYKLTSFTFGAYIGASDGPANITRYYVSIYSVAGSTTEGSLIGDVHTFDVLPASAITSFVPGSPRGSITLDLSAENYTLAAGSYSIGVTTFLNFQNYGQVYNLAHNGLAEGENSRFINPNNGFGLGVNSQIVDATDGVGGVNLNYKLEGQPVPEPATMAVLGLGAAATLRRRRKA